MKKPMTRKRALTFGLATLFTAGLAYSIVAPRTVAVEETIVRRGVFRETIQADGVLRSKERYVVSAFADGDIKRVDLKVGDEVRKGQAITELYWDVKYDPVKAPIAGVISRVFRESAGPIRRGEPIVEILNPERLEVVAELLTTDASRVSSGNPASVEGWGGESALNGKVVRVSKAGFRKQSALGVEEEKTEVTIDLVNMPKEVLQRVGSTFHVDVTIQVSRTDNALRIPSGAVFRDGDAWAVYKVESGRARKKRVSIAGRGERDLMVASGLGEGDRIVVYPGDLVKEGTKVRPIKAPG